MATLVLRATKGSPLTNNEADANFTNLNTEKIERTGTIPMSGTLVFVAADSSKSSFNIPNGSAPTTPTTGDIWMSSGVVKVRTSVSTKTVAYVEDGVLGYTGSRGATGFSGSKGDNGTTGATGFSGSRGFTGSVGPVGGAANQVVYKDSGNAVAGSNNLRFNGNGLAVGNITPSSTVGRIDAADDIVWFSTSDRRLKTNIREIPDALWKVKQLYGVTFDWDEKLFDIHGYKGRDTGLLAQDVQQMLPEVVTERENGYLAIKYEKIIGLLVEAIKELDRKLEAK